MAFRAGVYLFNEGKWDPVEPVASVWLMNHEAKKTYRVVASNAKKEFVLNAVITKTVTHSKASELFLEWKDTTGPVNGLNFAKVETMATFTGELQKAIDALSGEDSLAIEPAIPKTVAEPLTSPLPDQSNNTVTTTTTTPTTTITTPLSDAATPSIVAQETPSIAPQPSDVPPPTSTSTPTPTLPSPPVPSSTPRRDVVTLPTLLATPPRSGTPPPILSPSTPTSAPSSPQFTPALPRDSPKARTQSMSPAPATLALQQPRIRSSSSVATAATDLPLKSGSPPPSEMLTPHSPGTGRSSESDDGSAKHHRERRDSKSTPRKLSSKDLSSHRLTSQENKTEKRSSVTIEGSPTMPRAASPAPIEHSSLSPIPSIALVAAEPAPAAKDPAIEAAEKAAQEELKRIRLRDNYAKEIYSTEVTYVTSLQVAINVWIKPMVEKKIISDEEKRAIFSNIETICEFNQKLMEELGQRLEKWNTETTKIGDVFVSLAPYLRMYKQYCDNYDGALNTIEKCREKNKKFKDYLKTCEQRCSGVTLPFYLITPVQRIPRYNLLLRDLIKQTKTDHPDYNSIQEALKHIGTVADDINKSVLKAEKARAMADLLKRGFHGLDSLMAPHRHLVLDGPLLASYNSIECTWVLLFNDIIAFAAPIDKKEKEKKITKRQIQGYLEFNYTWCRTVPEVGDDAVELKTPEQAVLLRTKPREVDPKKNKEKLDLPKLQPVKANWCEEIQKVIKSWLLRPLTPAEKEFEINVELVKDDMCEARFTDYRFKDGSRYKGQWLNAKFSGPGRLESPNGTVFEGSFLRGGLQGSAKAAWSDGAKYEGEWQLDLPHGQGTLHAADGSVYAGQWAVGRKKGQGLLTWPNGDTFTGEWSADRFHGPGTLTRYAEKHKTTQREPLWVYAGEFKDGQRSGQGTLRGTDYTYSGAWERDQPHGQGEESSKAGKYKGNFARGRKEGSGEFTSTDGTVTYVGEYKYGEFHGKGKYTCSKNGYEFEGIYFEGRKHGEGKEVFGNGSTYVGSFEDDLFEGRGTLVTVIGDSFKGNFHRGCKFGEGTMAYVSGDKYVGDWYRDIREGSGTYTYADGTEYTGEWKYDKPHGQGKLFENSGLCYEGGFFQGLRHGKGRLETPEAVFDGEFKNGIQDGPGTLLDNKDKTLFTGEWKSGRISGNGTLSGEGEKKEVVHQIYVEGIMKNPGIKYYPPVLPDAVRLDWHINM